jgi:DNA invertase Pin-like site-specific DNA recombinase
MPAIVAYCRVSKKKQDMGLDAQQAAIERFCADQGHTVAATYIEKMSGKYDADERPQLDAAMKHAKRLKTSIVVAKLDRLSRSVHYISGLMQRKNGVKSFIVAQFPDADDFMLHIYASLAEQERKMISIRTREGLVIARQRGKTLGNPTLANVRAKGSAAVAAGADEFAARILPTIESIQSRGIVRLRDIAAELMRLNIRTARGSSTWYAQQVANILKRKRG